MSAPMICMRCGFSKVIFSLTCRNALVAAAKVPLHSKTPVASRCISLGSTNNHVTGSRWYGSEAGGESSDDEKTVRKKLDLAKPGKKGRGKPKAGGDDYKSQMRTATKAVSEALGGDTEKTQSELLAALRSHATAPDKEDQASGLTEEKAQETLKNLFSGMKVDSERRPQQRQFGGDGRPARQPRKLQDIELYSGEALGIFKKSTQPQEHVPNFYDVLEVAEMRKKSKFPTANAFEEMIDWTKEGKLWKFPIDNEQGLHEEAQVGFHEHVFLEHLLEEGFPARGPIRHFMELVIVGLSKNPYLSVQEKHAHVDWFRNYFKDKIEIVEALLDDNKSTDADNNVQA